MAAYQGFVEDALAVKALDSSSSPNKSEFHFIGKKPLWKPQGTRGIYGGSTLAQCLVAAQTVVPREYLCHSMHGYFILAGQGDQPLEYTVKITRKGKTFITAHVDALQNSKLIYTTILSFVRDDQDPSTAPLKPPQALITTHPSTSKKTLTFESPFPTDIPPQPDTKTIEAQYSRLQTSVPPFLIHETLLNPLSLPPHSRRKQLWLRTRGTICPQSGPQAHQAALALMTDCYYITAIAQLCRLPMHRFVPPWCADHEQKNFEPGLAPVGMMVSLDHSVYFHAPRAIRADEWVYAEMQPAWAGEERGLAMQRLYSREGKLLASCVQEVSL